MNAIDRLLDRALLLEDPQVSSDTVPYEDTAYPALPPESTPRRHNDRRELADVTADKYLLDLCDVALSHSTPGQLVDFITEQLPAPRAAWILGCILHLADAEDGARFWWQYAAGAGDPAASYCLHLHHLAHGDNHAAAFWHEQTGLDTQPTPGYRTADTSIPTVLRILSRLTPGTSREHTAVADAVMAYVAEAVAAGYDRNPGYEIPLPGRHFAADIEVILGDSTTLTAPVATHQSEPPATLPNRPEPNHGGRPDEAPERVLVQAEAADDESASAFKEAVAACWSIENADLNAKVTDQPGRRRLRYYLDRRPFIDAFRRCRTGVVQPS